MPLYLLTLRRPLEHSPNGLGVAYRFVVCALNPGRARELIITAPLDGEGPGLEGAAPWADPTKSDCIRLVEWGASRIVCRDLLEM